MQQQQQEQQRSQTTECAICLNSIGNKEGNIALTCQHVFCTECIREWAKHSQITCPTCRQPIDFPYYVLTHPSPIEHVRPRAAASAAPERNIFDAVLLCCHMLFQIHFSDRLVISFYPNCKAPAPLSYIGDGYCHEGEYYKNTAECG